MRRFARRDRLAACVATLILALLAPGAAAASSAAPAPAALPPGGLAPVLHVQQGTVEWSSLGVENSYEIAVSTAPRGRLGRVTVYITVPRASGEAQSYHPQLPPGAHAWIGVSADGGIVWPAREVRVDGPAVTGGAAPAAPVVEAAEATGPASGTAGLAPADVAPGGPASGEPGVVAAPIAPAKRIIGTNGGGGWGLSSAQKILAHHIAWDRVEVGSWQFAVSNSLSYGFKLLGIVGNFEDGRPLSRVEPAAWGAQVASQLRANRGLSLAEAGNEMYFKGGVANPVQYGRMYLAAVRAEQAAGLHVPLLFNMVGDYPRGSWSSPSGWSQDAAGGGWLRDAVNGVPGLAAAILANGIAIHPYGAPAQNVHDTWGAAAVAADEALARTVLGSIPPFYITEFGYRLDACGTGWGACSLSEQASRLRAAYAEFLADPHVAGVWWYESHDDSTGRFGYLGRYGGGRPALSALMQIAEGQGQ